MVQSVGILYTPGPGQKPWKSLGFGVFSPIWVSAGFTLSDP